MKNFFRKNFDRRKNSDILVITKLKNIKVMIEKELVKVDENGEIISADITTIKKVSYGEFMQVWLKDNQEFWDLTKSEYAVMVQCWRASIYYPELVDENLPGNKVTADKQFKDITAKNANITVRSVDSALSSLSKKNLLIKDKDYKGIYYLNPKLFFKGKISDRTKIIKHSIEYQIATNAISS